MRKLATIRVVDEIRPIEGADKICLAVIQGWQCVVQKTDFKPGDLCVFCEIDSFLPIQPQFEFLRKSSYKKLNDGSEGFRLKTIKLRGQLSQGLALPVKIAVDAWNAQRSAIDMTPTFYEPKVGDDVTDLLGVVKYEPPIPACLSGVVKGNFPSFVRKTDEERIQNLPDWFTMYKDVPFEASEKLDGSSCTIYYRDGEGSGVCSRNLDLKEDDANTFWRVAKELRVIEALKAWHEHCGQNFAVQGEVIGEGIAKNPYALKGQMLYVFNIYDIDHGRYLLPAERKVFMDHCEKAGFPLKHVPVLSTGDPVFRRHLNIEDILQTVKGKSVLNPKQDREGIVFKSEVLVGGDIISFKGINNDYLLGE